MAEIEKAVLGSVRLDSDVWDAVRTMPVSLNVYLRRSLLSSDSPFGDLVPKPRKLSKKAQAAEARKAADPIAQNLGREDIDYMNPDELPSAGSVGAAIQRDIKEVQRDFNRPPHIATADWRANRKPLPKPKDAKK